MHIHFLYFMRRKCIRSCLSLLVSLFVHRALIRPGRFDRRVVITLPDVRARHDILRVHSAKVKLSPEVDLEILARGTSGFSGGWGAGTDVVVLHASTVRCDSVAFPYAAMNFTLSHLRTAPLTSLHHFHRTCHFCTSHQALLPLRSRPGQHGQPGCPEGLG